MVITTIDVDGRESSSEEFVLKLQAKLTSLFAGNYGGNQTATLL